MPDIWQCWLNPCSPIVTGRPENDPAPEDDLKEALTDDIPPEEPE